MVAVNCKMPGLPFLFFDETGGAEAPTGNLLKKTTVQQRKAQEFKKQKKKRKKAN
jgi:hypothetical protein